MAAVSTACPGGGNKSEFCTSSLENQGNVFLFYNFSKLLTKWINTMYIPAWCYSYLITHYTLISGIAGVERGKPLTKPSANRLVVIPALDRVLRVHVQAEQVGVLLVGAKPEGLDEGVELRGVGLQVLPDHLGKSVGSVVAHLEIRKM